MGISSVPGIHYQDKISGVNAAFFPGLNYHNMPLLAIAGYKPIKVKLAVYRAGVAPRLIVEYADGLQRYSKWGVVFIKQRRIFYQKEESIEGEFRGEHKWLPSGFTLVGDTGIITGNELVFQSEKAQVNFDIRATTALLRNPLFRIRRAGQTKIAAEALGVGNGTLTGFSFQMAKFPVYPGSVRISFSDSSGVRVDEIVDDMEGHLCSVPPDLLLSGISGSTIDYKNGKININFNADYIPAAAAITIDYEYPVGKEDDSEYRIDWSYE